KTWTPAASRTANVGNWRAACSRQTDCCFSSSAVQPQPLGRSREAGGTLEPRSSGPPCQLVTSAANHITANNSQIQTIDRRGRSAVDRSVFESALSMNCLKRPNDTAQQRGRQERRHTTQRRNAGPVCWSELFRLNHLLPGRRLHTTDTPSLLP